MKFHQKPLLTTRRIADSIHQQAGKSICPALRRLHGRQRPRNPWTPTESDPIPHRGVATTKMGGWAGQQATRTTPRGSLFRHCSDGKEKRASRGTGQALPGRVRARVRARGKLGNTERPHREIVWPFLSICTSSGRRREFPGRQHGAARGNFRYRPPNF